MFRIIAIPVLTVCLTWLGACTPYRYRLSQEGQADARAEYRTETFVVAPPAGRWVADTIPPGVATRGWPPRMEFLSYPRNCKPGFAGFYGDVTCFVEPIAARPLAGYVFCRAPSIRLGLEAKPDSLSACLLVRSYELKPAFHGIDGNRAALDTLAIYLKSFAEKQWYEQQTLWQALTMKSSGPRRGALRAISIGRFTFTRLLTVVQADTVKVARGRIDEQALVHFLSDRFLLIAMNQEADWLTYGTEEWKVVESVQLLERALTFTLSIYATPAWRLPVNQK